MKRLLIPFLALALCPSAQAQPFVPFNAVYNGKDCQVTLQFPEADLCGTPLRPDQVIGWYNHEREDKGGGNFIYTTAEMHQVRFFDPGAGKRFFVEFQIWSGRPPITTGSSSLHLGI